MWFLILIVLILIFCNSGNDSLGLILIRGLFLILFVGLCIVNPIIGIAILAIGLFINKKN